MVKGGETAIGRRVVEQRDGHAALAVDPERAREPQQPARDDEEVATPAHQSRPASANDT